MAKPCTVCGGRKYIGNPPNAQACPVCGGTGNEYDPGTTYDLTLDFTIAGNSVNQAANITLVDNRPFRLVFAKASSTGPFTFTITDASTNRNFSNAAIHQNNFFGTAQNPYPLVTPYVFNKQVQFVFNDLSGGANRIFIALGGVLLSQ